MAVNDYMMHGVPDNLTVNGRLIAGVKEWDRLPTENKHRALRLEVARSLPKLWLVAIDRQARRVGLDLWAQCNVYIDWLVRFSGAKSADMSESDLRDKAERYAKQAGQEFFTRIMRDASGVHQLDAMLSMYEHMEHFVSKRLGFFVHQSINGVRGLNGLIKRLECASWWRKQLRRLVARQYERGCFELGMIGAKFGAWFCSDRAVIRRKQQNRANAEMLAAREVVNEAGQVMTLADIAARSVSNKAIRRGELMTRISGCEAWANANGLVGLFTTNTLPSRFHSNLHGGGKNPKYDGSLPDAGQKWLCAVWARLRAQLARDGVPLVGFRVVEPHHDGCPHWHMLLWCKPEHVDTVSDTMRRYWLQDSGDEAGADKYRVNIKEMVQGQAAGYVAKYIAKNIDGQHVDTQFDLSAAGSEQFFGSEYIQGEKIDPSMRVEAWATLWRIRQFQLIGQPSVTVWRDLRRVSKQAAAGGSDAFIHAYLAVHKDKARGRDADWHKYMNAQGGAMLKRKDYRLCVHAVDRVVNGRYDGLKSQAWSCGVRDRLDSGAVPSKRMRWVNAGAGSESAFSPPPWTRLNNCTQTFKPDKDLIQKMRDTSERLRQKQGVLT